LTTTILVFSIIKMDEIVKVTFSIDWQLLKEFDKLLKNKGLENRSKVIRKLIESFIFTEKIKQKKISEQNEGLFVIIANSSEPLTIKKHLHITIPAESDYITIILIGKTTYKKAELELSCIEKENSLKFSKLIQI